MNRIRLFEYATSSSLILSPLRLVPRLFTALDLPDSALDALRVFRDSADLPTTARWTPRDNHHITLRFIGDVDGDRAASIEKALEAIRTAPIEIEPLGLGVLPSRRNPRVLTVRIEPTEPLRSLYNALQNTLETVDVETEDRTYRPHITLARLKDTRPEQLYAVLRDMDGPHIDSFTVDCYHLYESTLTPDGAVHTVRATYPLNA